MPATATEKKDILKLERARVKAAGGKKSKHNTHSRKKKTQLMKTLNGLGIWPFAPTKMAAVGGVLNGYSSIFLGKDLENGFLGSTSVSQTQVKAGEREDLFGYIALTQGQPLGPRFRHVLLNWSNAFTSSFTTTVGFNRTVTPAIAGAVIFAAAKATNANSFIPPQIRKFIRVS